MRLEQRDGPLTRRARGRIHPQEFHGQIVVHLDDLVRVFGRCLGIVVRDRLRGGGQVQVLDGALH